MRKARPGVGPSAGGTATPGSGPPGGPAVGPPSGPIATISRTLAFGVAAPVYSFLTAHETWRASCRALGALVPGPRVLDLGVGPGTSALETPQLGAIHVGLDVSGRMLGRAARLARSRGVNLPLVQADAMALPVRDGTLDGVTGHSVLYLLPDPFAALAEIRRALRRGGRVAVLEPRAAHASPCDALRGGVRCLASMLLWRAMSGLHVRFDEEELVRLAERAGFRRARAWPVLAGYGVMAVADRAD